MSTSPLFVASVAKAFSILDCFRHTANDLSLMEMVQLSGMDKSAAQRYAHTLCELGMLEQNSQTRRYRLGKKVLNQTFDYLRTNAFVESVNPLLLDICEKTGERISLSLIENDELVHVMRHQTKTQEYQASLVGRRVPVFCTAGGRASLASLGPSELEAWLKGKEFHAYTPDTVTDHHKLRTVLSQIRRKGYALVVNEFIHGEIALGAAVLSDDGKPFAAIHISGSAWEWGANEYEKKFAPILMNVISRIQRPLRT